jgi:glycosyltransferase involved in cell wall biosynthesis
MASETPIIASNLPSLKEILNNKNCVFFESDNPENLAEKIIDLSQNEQKQIDISKQAFQDVQKYTWQKRAKDILSFIK